VASDEWSTVQAEYTVPLDADPGEVTITVGAGEARGAAGGYTYLIDDVQVTYPRTDAPTDDAGLVVLSADFEHGFDGWAARDNGTGPPRIIVVDDAAHSGDQAALVSERTSQGSGIGIPVTGLLVPGTTYEVRAALRFAAGEQPDDIWLTLQRSSNGSDDAEG